MSSHSLQNKKIIISAGASGIGWATTKVCVAKGASVYLCDIDLKAINKVKKHPLYNKRIFVSEADASDEIQVIDFFSKIKKKFKNLDALINNVGIEGPTKPIEKLESNEWENTLHVNVNSHFYFTKQAIPLLKNNKGGSIINISSTAGLFGLPLRTPYVASKWAIIGVTKSLAMELGEFNIRVNAICPGSVSGDRMKRVVEAKAKSTGVSEEELQKDYESMVSLKTFVNKEDIANMALFLLSKEARKISGQVMTVDGNTERMN